MPARRRQNARALPYSRAQQNAIDALRANWPGAGRVKVFDRRREWGCALVKAGGQRFLVFGDGRIKEEG